MLENMSKLYLTVLLSVIYFSVQAQAETYTTSPLSTYGSGVNLRVADLPTPPPDLDNSLYLVDDWSIGNILLADGRIIKKCTLRYDIANGFIEIQDKTAIRAVKEIDVKQLAIEAPPITRWFVNASIYKNEKNPKHSLMEVLVDGDIKLLVNSEVEIIKPNGGFTDQRREVSADPITSRKIVKYYLAKDDQLMDISSKGKVLKAFAPLDTEMKSYAKSKKVGFNKQNDLMTLVTEYARQVQANSKY